MDLGHGCIDGGWLAEVSFPDWRGEFRPAWSKTKSDLSEELFTHRSGEGDRV